MHSVAKEVFQQSMLDQPMLFSPYGDEARPGFSIYSTDSSNMKPLTSNYSPARGPAVKAKPILNMDDFLSGEKQLTPEMVLKQMTDRYFIQSSWLTLTYVFIY